MISVPDSIKEKLHLDHCQKNIRIHFPNGERRDICNDLIVKDSVSFTESLCSQNTLKFGLCESPVFECEVVGVGNIKGATIEVYCEVECDSAVEDSVFRNDLQKYVYPIPYGVFVVQECKRQADMQHRKIVAYGNLLYAVNEINRVERMKETYSYGETQRTYTPTALYYSITNLNLSNYDNTVFNEEEIQGGQTSSGYGDRWFYEHRELLLTLETSINEWNVSAADTDALYYYEIDYGGIKAAREIIIETLDRYDYPFSESVARLMECFMRISWSGSFTGGGLISREDLNEENPSIVSRIFYPYIMGATAQITSGGPGVNRLTIEYANTHEIIEQIDIENIVKSVRLIKLTAKSEYSDIAAIKLSIQSKQVSNNYYELDLEEENKNADVLNSLMEFMGLFGRINRFNAFEALNIKRKFLITPSSTLYPEGTLYPGRPTGGSILPKDYQTCWYDDEYLKPFGAIICTFENTSNVNVLYTLYLPGYDSQTDPNLYQVYDLSNNYFINTFLWTEQQIQAFCQNIINNIEGVTYMPVDFTGRGLPYVEAGDTFEILTKSNDSITTIVLNRTLTGEQTLTDTYKSV